MPGSTSGRLLKDHLNSPLPTISTQHLRGPLASQTSGEPALEPLFSVFPANVCHKSDSQPGRQADSQTGRQPDSQTARQADRQQARQPDTQTARNPDRRPCTHVQERLVHPIRRELHILTRTSDNLNLFRRGTRSRAAPLPPIYFYRRVPPQKNS